MSGLGVLSGGGRDNIIEHNIFAYTQGTMSTDRRAQAVANNSPGDSWNLLERINSVFESYHYGDAIAYQSSPWSDRYPELAAIPNDWSMITGSHWLDPEGCVFSGNFAFQSTPLTRAGTWGGPDALTYWASTDGNVEGDPLFVDETGGDLHLQSGSPALAIPGFVPTDLDTVGPRP